MNEIRQLLAKKVENITTSDFEELALDIFRYQAQYNPLYADYLQLLGVQPEDLTTLSDIPFLPISFFKSHDIRTGNWSPECTFTSSGTTGQATSRHLVADMQFYLRNAQRGFEYFYGDVSQYCILALLPSYLERTGSSLIAMAEYFVQKSRYTQSGFFLYNTAELIEILIKCIKSQTPTLLLGVSFALLDLAEQHPMMLEGIIIMETGGMKGRRREPIREELHEILRNAFRVGAIHSEYGMTELFSQAYSKANGIFYPTRTMRVQAREITDPLAQENTGKTGAINIIDLANLDTISFIATDDLGKVYNDGSFEILGRLDNSDIRGCNLMIQ